MCPNLKKNQEDENVFSLSNTCTSIACPAFSVHSSTKHLLLHEMGEGYKRDITCSKAHRKKDWRQARYKWDVQPCDDLP